MTETRFEKSSFGKMIAIVSRQLDTDERETAIAFLRREGYSRSIEENDLFFVSELAGEIVGTVRLSWEEGSIVLRGMRVRGDVQRRGVGTNLLRSAVLDLTSDDCYCIPYRWLIPFYAQAGFREVGVEDAPPFLASRHAKYVSDGLDVVILYRPPE